MSDRDFHQQITLPGLPTPHPGDTPKKKSFTEEPPLPAQIGPYKIEKLLSHGGMSHLYLGFHPTTREPTAIKVLSERLLSHPEMVHRFLKEAEIIAMSNHPNIVKLYGHGEWEKGLYIAMEFVRGISLRQYIMETPITLRRSLEIIIDIAYALCHLHTHGIIHRDLKPENILMTETGEVKVIDFGISQLLTEKSTSSAGQVMGTPVYMSPEQKKDPASVSFPSDIYSLGIIAYEIVLGKLSQGHIHLGLMPQELQKILTKALQQNPKDRYEDIVDFIAALSSYFHSSTLKRERFFREHLGELSEGIKQAQQLLLPNSPPDWPQIDLGVAGQRALGISGVYYDYFQINDGIYGVVMGEPSSMGAEGAIYSAVVRGMIRTLYRLTSNPAELVTLLNDLLVKDRIEQSFALTYLTIDTNTGKLRYISCGYDNMWMLDHTTNIAERIPATNIALGIDVNAKFEEKEIPIPYNSSFVFHTFALGQENKGSNAILEGTFKKAIEEMTEEQSQKFADSLLLKLKVGNQAQFHDRANWIIAIRFTSELP